MLSETTADDAASWLNFQKQARVSSCASKLLLLSKRISVSTQQCAFRHKGLFRQPNQNDCFDNQTEGFDTSQNTTFYVEMPVCRKSSSILKN